MEEKGTAMNADLAERLSEDLAAIARDAGEIFDGNGNGDNVAARARDIRDRLADVLQATDKTIEDLNEKPSSALGSVDEFIRERPYQALGIVLGVGLLLGWLIKRK